MTLDIPSTSSMSSISIRYSIIIRSGRRGGSRRQYDPFHPRSTPMSEKEAPHGMSNEIILKLYCHNKQQSNGRIYFRAVAWALGDWAPKRIGFDCILVVVYTLATSTRRDYRRTSLHPSYVVRLFLLRLPGKRYSLTPSIFQLTA